MIDESVTERTDRLLKEVEEEAAEIQRLSATPAGFVPASGGSGGAPPSGGLSSFVHGSTLPAESAAGLQGAAAVENPEELDIDMFDEEAEPVDVDGVCVVLMINHGPRFSFSVLILKCAATMLTEKSIPEAVLGGWVASKNTNKK